MSRHEQAPGDQAPAVHGPPDWNRVWVALAGLLLSYAVFYRLVLIANGWPAFDSDQAIMGLMARHIWLHGERPLFFYGLQYLGPGEAYVAVPFFALFGSSVLTLRLAMLPLILLFLALVYIIGRIAYGPVAGLLALAWLVVGPSVAVFRELATEGGKQEMLVLSGVIVLCAWARLRMAERRPRDRRGWLQCLVIYVLLGVACGLAIWSDWLSAPLVVATALVLLVARPREVLSWAGVALVLGFLLAAWPFIQFNVMNQFVSVSQVLYFSGNSSGTLVSRLAGLPAQVGTAATISLPAVFGSSLVCGQPADGASCSLVNGTFSLLIVALYALAAWPLVRAVRAYGRDLRKRLQLLQLVPQHVLLGPVGAAMLWRRLDAPVAEADARRSARLWVRCILLTSALVVLAAFVYNPLDQVYPLDKTRYLVPLYFSAPVLFGALWDALRPALEYTARSLGWGWWGSHERGIETGDMPAIRPRLSRSQKTLALGAGFMLILLLTLSVSNGISTVIASEDAATYAVPEPPWSARILAVFDAHGVRTFYSDSYYDCYNLAFESNERQICAVLGTDGKAAPETWINRYQPYVAAVAQDPHPAYLLRASPDEETEFKRGNLPSMGYTRTEVDGFAIYYYRSAA